jgi:Protein of unknown function (DUF1385)
MGRPAHAGRPFLRYNGDMDAAAELLQRADAAPALPRLGGMARPNGVVIVSERRWAFAGVDGSLREGAMPQPPELLQRLPLARGLVRLWASLAPVLRPGGVAPSRERWLIVGAVLAPLGLAFVGGRWSTAGGIALSLLLLVTILRGRALHLHGAEHRAIAAAEERRLVATWNATARPSRFSPRCGTNFAALALPVTFLADRALPIAPAFWSPAVVLVLSLALTMELWRMVQKSSHGFWHAFLVPGLALQRVTTREPTPAETQVALRAVAAVLQHELR